MKRRSAAATLAILLVSIINVPLSASAQETTVSQEQYWQLTSSGLVRERVGQLPAQPVAVIPIPVLFGVAPGNLTPNFGDPRSGGRTHEGEDIMAPKGVPIVSPTQAVVLGIGVWEGAGNYVSTANPGGETFVYMHLDRPSSFLSPGDVLQPGDFIGYVGNTGNAAGGATHLHFEIRKNGATDPYPRLKTEFTLAQKVGFTSTMLSRLLPTDRAALAEVLVRNYRGQFVLAQAEGLALPPDIVTEMQKTPAAGAGAAVVTTAMLPGDLQLGSRGSAVVGLQNLLIAQNKGPAARALAAAGATGNFGAITKSALIEYQIAVGVVPADGYYGPLTRAYAQNATTTASTPGGGTTATTTSTNPTPPAPIRPTVPTRDLKLGAQGVEVIWLQTFLINLRSGPAATKLAQSGATGYFGSITRNALIEYQAKNGISPAAGYFGPLTRARMLAATTTP